MVSSSINSFSLHSHSQLVSPKILIHTSQSSLKPLSIISIHHKKSFFLFPKFQNVPLRISPNCFHLHQPTSNLSVINCLPSPQKTITKYLTKKIVVLLLGSFIFMGCLRSRPVVAAEPEQKSGYSETMEQETEIQNGKSEDEVMYVKLLEENPRNVEALKVIVNLKMRKGKTKEAVEYVERMIDIEPSKVEWRLLQAFCYEIMGQFSKAKRLFKEILKQRPLLLRALHGLAMVMHKNHEGMAVFKMLNEALEVAHRETRVTEERNIRILIAQMHVVKGQLEEGLRKFQELVDENPRDFRPYLCQGIIYSLLDKKKEAEEQFEVYQNLVPEEFPQRRFLDDVLLAAKTDSRQKLEEEFKAEFSYKN